MISHFSNRLFLVHTHFFFVNKKKISLIINYYRCNWKLYNLGDLKFTEKKEIWNLKFFFNFDISCGKENKNFFLTNFIFFFRYILGKFSFRSMYRNFCTIFCIIFQFCFSLNSFLCFLGFVSSFTSSFSFLFSCFPFFLFS